MCFAVVMLPYANTNKPLASIFFYNIYIIVDWSKNNESRNICCCLLLQCTEIV